LDHIAIEATVDFGFEFRNCSFARLAEMSLELAESDLDRILIRNVGRQVFQGRAHAYNRHPHLLGVMSGQVVHLT
jgi:hypothetical protein